VGVLRALVLAGASACATTETADDRVNPEVPTWFSRPSGAMHLFVDRALTATSRAVGEDWERGRAEIDPVRGRVFVGSSDHGLYALRAGNGSTIWRYETLGAVQSEPLYDRELDVLYFGSNDGALYAVRAQDGVLVWRFSSGAEVARRPVVDGERLMFANASDQLFAVNRRTGKQLWTAHRTPALGMEVAGYAGPAVDHGLVYMAYSDGHVIAYDAQDGSEKWTPVDLSAEAEQSAGGDAPRYLDVDTTPIVDVEPNGRVVYVASYAGGVFALDALTGARLWAAEKAVGVTELVLFQEPAHAPTPSGPFAGGPQVPARKVLLAASGSSGLWSLDPASGRENWRIPVPEGGITSPVQVMGAIVVGTTRYGLFLISPLNGKVIDGIDLESGFSQTPAAWGDRVYAMSNQGTFLGFQVESPLARYRK
jgi:outer membrane protein assembly factor BamB